MNWKTTVVVIVILAFGVLTGCAVAKVGYIGILDAGLANWGSMQIFVDLVISRALACVWMVLDAREYGANPWPYVVITLFAGSFGPLLYLLRRMAGRRPVSAQAV